ncbi:hypothetical protein C8F01DRAFT_1076860 [Mycena amicta]|nr:hypothetical protein C8F01DRAFT_1076860 [Mycena amicta]
MLYQFLSTPSQNLTPAIRAAQTDDNCRRTKLTAQRPPTLSRNGRNCRPQAVKCRPPPPQVPPDQMATRAAGRHFVWSQLPSAAQLPPTAAHSSRMSKNKIQLRRLEPYLTAPSLKTLVIRDLGENAAVDFLKRSSCRITTLIVEFTCEARMTPVISILKLCPELTYLLLYRSEAAAGQHDDDNGNCQPLFDALRLNVRDDQFDFDVDDCESISAKLPPKGPREDADAFSKMLRSRGSPFRRDGVDRLQFMRVGRQDKMLHWPIEWASRSGFWVDLDAKVIPHRTR